jgi:hypothetical protein
VQQRRRAFHSSFIAPAILFVSSEKDAAETLAETEAEAETEAAPGHQKIVWN